MVYVIDFRFWCYNGCLICLNENHLADVGGNKSSEIHTYESFHGRSYAV